MTNEIEFIARGKYLVWVRFEPEYMPDYQWDVVAWMVPEVRTLSEPAQGESCADNDLLTALTYISNVLDSWHAQGI